MSIVAAFLFFAALPLAALGDIAAPHTPDPWFLGMLVVGLLTLVTLADKVDGFIQRRRRQPPVDVDLGRVTSSIAALTELVRKNEERIARLEEKHEEAFAAQRSYSAKSNREIFDTIRALSDTVSNNFRQVENSLGNLKGTCDQLNERLKQR
ncbi:hypothetical protein [Geminisphaera colitermitum]|uniref:hypothetical protein n=1 Tax=Geminisphaera colitermitum TaxID=1148786 RepID=UPI000158C724|nr:hypothetical protein [Geminisphaera colitermitum]